MVSIIVPVLNEEKTIQNLIGQLNMLDGDKEIIVVDGGSSDRTVEISSRYAKTVCSEKGRAFQMNKGAREAEGDIFWFVHSDSRVDRGSIKAIKKVIQEGYIGGGFCLSFYDYNTPFLRFVSSSSNLRARYLGLYYGDQGIFVKRDVFESIGGFPQIPIMEDWEMGLMLKKQGLMKMVNITIETSARRFKSGGAFKTLMLMHKIKMLHLLGVNPDKLIRIYREAR